MGYAATIKGWLKRGYKPLESQFAQWVDFTRLKDEPIPMDDVTGLTGSLGGKADTATVTVMQQRVLPDIFNRSVPFYYDVEGNVMLETIGIKSPVDGVLTIGTTLGGNDIVEAFAYIANECDTVTILNLSNVDRRLYFGGITADCLFYFYKR